MYFKNISSADFDVACTLLALVLLFLCMSYYVFKFLIKSRSKCFLITFVASFVLALATGLWAEYTPTKAGYTSLAQVSARICITFFVLEFLFYLILGTIIYDTDN